MSRAVLKLTVLILFVSSFVCGQRPPYAGSRPSGYKDRFRPRPTGTTATSINDIDNRFGELANNLDNSTNVTQRPPMGVEVVYGEPSDPNDLQLNSVNGTNQQQPQQFGINIADRLGEQQSETDQQPQQQLPSAGIDQNITENSSNDLFTGGLGVPVAAGVSTRPTVIPIRQTTLGHVPYDAHGDVFLVNLLNQRPVDQQPFWFVNYQAIEAHRNGTTSS